MTRAQELINEVEYNCTGWPCPAVMDLAARLSGAEAELASARALLCATIKEEKVFVADEDIKPHKLVRSIRRSGGCVIWAE